MEEVLCMNIYILPKFLQMELVVPGNWIQLNVNVSVIYQKYEVQE